MNSSRGNGDDRGRGIHAGRGLDHMANSRDYAGIPDMNSEAGSAVKSPNHSAYTI